MYQNLPSKSNISDIRPTTCHTPNSLLDNLLVGSRGASAFLFHSNLILKLTLYSRTYNILC